MKKVAITIILHTHSYKLWKNVTNYQQKKKKKINDK